MVLSAEEKMVILIHDGIEIACRRDPLGSYYLFQLDHFYAEVAYDPGDGSPVAFTCFTGTAPLEPYLERISLEGILD